jgi:hypothetical protein
MIPLLKRVENMILNLAFLLENMFIVIPVSVLLASGLSYGLRHKQKFLPQIILILLGLAGIVLGLLTALDILGFIIGIFSLVTGVLSLIIVAIFVRKKS